MIGIYGNRLTRDFGDSVPDPWQRAVHGLKDHEIQRGVNRLIAGGSGSPPTLPQFVRACRELRDDDEIPPPANALPDASYDFLHTMSQRILLSFLRHQAIGASRESLLVMIQAKNELVKAYRWILQEEPEAGPELHDKLMAKFTELYRPIEGAELEHLRSCYYPTRIKMPTFTEAEIASLNA